MLLLSKLIITGLPDDNTPMCVLSEICLSHQVPVVDIKLILESPIPALPEDYNIQDYQEEVACFINPAFQWPLEDLQEAFDNALQYYHSYVIPNDFTFGPVNPQEPRNLDACILYRLCRHYGLTTHRDTTLYEMGTMINLLKVPSDFLRSVLETRLSSLSRNQMIDILNILPGENIISQVLHCPKLDIDYQSMINRVTELQNINYLRKIVVPRNIEDAILLAALNYKYDLTFSSSPLEEYKNLEDNSADPHKGFLPLDPANAFLYTKNPDIFNLQVYFNPYLPYQVYTSMRIMALNEGYSSSEINLNGEYESLQVAVLTNTFYPGLQPGIQNQMTPILAENIKDIDPHVLVCYGDKFLAHTLVAYHMKELAETFRINKNFVDPLNIKTCFNKLSVKKLKLIAKKKCVGESPYASIIKNRLYQAIIETEIFIEDNLQLVRVLYSKYQKRKHQKHLQLCLRSLFDLAMTMRGWLHEGAYPIKLAPVDNQSLVDLHVSQEMATFESYTSGKYSYFLDLPLFYYREEFYPTNDVSQGLSIRERLKIIKNGDEHNNYSSCIRLSSNWLAYTAYYLHSILGLEVPFVLEELRSIS